MLDNAATGGAQRHTRYKCVSNPPEHIENILRSLEQRMRKNRPFSGEGKELRGFLAGIDGCYRNKGQADDCIRFLKNVGVLLADGDKKVYADVYRHVEILEACKDRRVPKEILPEQTDAIRVAKIKDWIIEAQGKATSSNPPSTACVSQAPVSEHALILSGQGMEGTDELLMLTDAELSDYAQRLDHARAKLIAEMCVVRAEETRRIEEAQRAQRRQRLESLQVAKEMYKQELRKKQAELQEIEDEISKLESLLTRTEKNRRSN